MTKYTFIAEMSDSMSDMPNTKVTYETDAVSVDDLLSDFRNFMLASGFQVHGELVEDYEDEI